MKLWWVFKVENRVGNITTYAVYSEKEDTAIRTVVDAVGPTGFSYDLLYSWRTLPPKPVARWCKNLVILKEVAS